MLLVNTLLRLIVAGTQATAPAALPAITKESALTNKIGQDNATRHDAMINLRTTLDHRPEILTADDPALQYQR